MNEINFFPETSLFQDSLFKRVVIAVIVLHCTLFVGAWLHPNFSRVQPVVKPVVIKTVKLNPNPVIKPTPSAAITSTQAVLPSPKPAPKPKEVPKKEKEVPKKEKEGVKEAKPVSKETKKEGGVKSTVVTKPQPTQSLPAPKTTSKSSGLDKALVVEAQKVLANITSKPATNANLNKSNETKLSAPALTLFAMESQGGINSDLSSVEVGYCDELIARMRLFLRLPTYGDVKVRLTVKKNGSVAKVEIISSASADNRNYVEKTLPEVQFPSFGQNFSGEEQHMFLVTLTNE